MAEESLPVESASDVSPASADNGTYDGDSGSYDSYDDSSSSTSTQTTPQLWERLGYDSEEALENTHTRYKQQVSGSYQETQRLRDEIAARDQRLREFEQGSQARQGAGTPGQPPAGADQSVSLAQAFEAYLNNDTATLARYEQQQARQVDDRLLSTLSTVVKPAQYSDMVIQDYPDLNDPKTPMYRQLYERYDAEAAHPRYRLLFPDTDQTALRDAYSPDGTERKRVDMRIVAMMAPKIAADLARNEGRKEEARRRGAAQGGDNGANRRSHDGEPSEWNLMTPEEQREIRRQLSDRQFPDDWPKTPEGVAKKIVEGWKKRTPSKYSTRVEMFRSGHPIRIAS